MGFMEFVREEMKKFESMYSVYFKFIFQKTYVYERSMYVMNIDRKVCVLFTEL